MGYSFLALSLMSGIIKGYCGKRTGNITEGYSDALLANILRMIFCTVIGIILITAGGNAQGILIEPGALLVCAVSGIATSFFVVSWLLSVKSGAYMMVEVFLMLSVLFPIITGIFIFDETVRWTQWVGIAILVLATLIMCSYNSSIKGTTSVKSIALLLVCCLSYGITDFSQKLFATNFSNESVSVFNFYTYLFSAVTLIILMLLSKDKPKNTNETITKFKGIFRYILIMSVCLFANSFFKTKAAFYLDSAQLYPLNQGAALILSTLMASVAFKEKLTAKAVIGILLSFVGIIVINVL